jgi:hypothetical protein
MSVWRTNAESWGGYSVGGSAEHDLRGETASAQNRIWPRGGVMSWIVLTGVVLGLSDGDQSSMNSVTTTAPPIRIRAMSSGGERWRRVP